MRIDVYLVQQKLYPTRAKATAAIDMGLVFVNGQLCKKYSQNIKENDDIKVNSLPFVSGRGSLKLAHALDYFNIDPAGLTCLDIGASTGGFTEILLNRGATQIFAVDVGTNQLIPELRMDKRVVSLENTDIRTLPVIKPVDLAVIDVSFISLDDIAGSVADWNPAQIIALIKPQFEVSSSISAKFHGIIKNEKYHVESIEKARFAFAKFGYIPSETIKSPIKGGSGNIEYLIMFNRGVGKSRKLTAHPF